MCRLIHMRRAAAVGRTWWPAHRPPLARSPALGGGRAAYERRLAGSGPGRGAGVLPDRSPGGAFFVFPWCDPARRGHPEGTDADPPSPPRAARRITRPRPHRPVRAGRLVKEGASR
jgi:hypothetical protein